MMRDQGLTNLKLLLSRVVMRERLHARAIACLMISGGRKSLPLHAKEP